MVGGELAPEPGGPPKEGQLDARLTDKQILGRLKADLKGWRVEVAKGHSVEITTPNGRVIRRRFDELRNPVALQSAIESIRRQRG